VQVSKIDDLDGQIRELIAQRDRLARERFVREYREKVSAAMIECLRLMGDDEAFYRKVQAIRHLVVDLDACTVTQMSNLRAMSRAQAQNSLNAQAWPPPALNGLGQFAAGIWNR
jgi:hypothetical protein